METEPQQEETPESQRDEDGARERAPAGLVEHVLANFRPQPAIPAVLVFMLSVMIPVLSQAPGGATGSDSVFMWLVPLGIVASCGLAIAAGFCSLFPQLIWIAAAVWAMKFTDHGPLPGYNRYVLMVGIVAAAVMLVVQVWRVLTGRFVPTIREPVDDEIR